MSNKVNVTITITAALSSTWTRDTVIDPPVNDEPVEATYTRTLGLTAPTIRYHTLSDKKIIKERTGPLGLEAGDGWIAAPIPETGKSEEEPDPPEVDEEGNLGNPVEVIPYVDPKPPAACLVFEKSHAVSFSDEELLTFNDEPFLLFTLGDNDEGNATACNPGQTSYDLTPPPVEHDTDGNVIDSPPPPLPAVGRNFLFSTVMDLSSFITQDTPIVQEFGNLDLESINEQDPLATTLATGKWAGDYPSTPPPPPGLRYLSITVTPSTPLLTDPKALSTHNPLTISLRNLKDLPGVRVTSLAALPHVTPTAFTLLEKYAECPYAIVTPFHADIPICKRVTRSCSVPHRPDSELNFTTTYLTGHIDRQRLIEGLSNCPVKIELQDRQPLKTVASLTAETLRWEMELAGPADGPAGDIFDVDVQRLAAMHAGWKTAGDACSHGTTSVPLGGLLSQAKMLADAYKRASEKRNGGDKKAKPAPLPRPSIKQRVDVLQEKRRRIPKGGLDEWQLTDEEHLIRKTGNYLSDSEVPLQHADMHLNYRSSTTSFGVTINLETPVLSLAEGDAERTGPPSEVIYRPFTRAVYTFEYGNVELLQALNKAIAAVNEEALKDTMIGSLMSYEFSEEEIAAANDATLNVIGGFMVLDDDSRMVFIEGTAEGMNRVLEAVPRSQANDWSFRVLSNPDVRFKDRLYTSFNVDLKKVRFRDPLPFLNAMPEIYNRAKVSEECFEALHRLGEIRHGNRLSEASMLQMFPTAGMITSIESKYGESISLEDILGVKPKKKIRSWEVVDEQVVEEEVQVVEEKKGPPVRNGPTDDKNPEFDKYLKTRKAPDYIGEQTVLLKEAQEDADRRRVKREEEDALEDPNRHTYSTQKLAYTEIKKAQMRDRLRKEKNCTFTYSKDYTSQTISMVDAERLSQVQLEDSKKLEMTKGGFTYPAPRKPESYAVHPSKPSESRIDILGEEWVENEMHPEDVKRTFEFKEGQKDFNTVPSNGKMIFGGFEAPSFERNCDTTLIGDSGTLPRGKIIEVKNNDFFSSVFGGGTEEGLFEEQQAEAKRAEEEWNAKVCVDSLDFLVGGFVQKDRPDQLDRVSDILHGPALKKSLLIVRNARLPSGKRVPLRPAPYSMFSQEEFSDPKDFTEDLRPNDATTYLVTNKDTGVGEDFFRYIHHHTGKPKSQTFVAKTSIKPLSDKEVDYIQTGRFQDL